MDRKPQAVTTLRSSSVTEPLEAINSLSERIGLSGLISSPKDYFLALSKLGDTPLRSFVGRQLLWVERSISAGWRAPGSGRMGADGISKATIGKTSESIVFHLLGDAVTLVQKKAELEHFLSQYSEDWRFFRFKPEDYEADGLMNLDGSTIYKDLSGSRIDVSNMPDLIATRGEECYVIDFKYTARENLETLAYKSQIALYIQCLRRLTKPDNVIFSSSPLSYFYAGLLRLSPEVLHENSRDSFIQRLKTDPLSLFVGPYGKMWEEDELRDSLTSLGTTLYLILSAKHYFQGEDGDEVTGDFNGCRIFSSPSGFKSEHFIKPCEVTEAPENCASCYIRGCGFQRQLSENPQLRFLSPSERAKVFNELRSRWAEKTILPSLQEKGSENLPLRILIENAEAIKEVKVQRGDESPELLGEGAEREKLTPLQFSIKDYYKPSEVSHSTLIISPPASGKTISASYFISKALEESPHSLIVYMVNLQSLVSSVASDLKEIFRGDRDEISEIDEESIIIRHGSYVAPSPKGKPIKILVTTYHYGMALLEHDNQFSSSSISLIIGDEIHAKLRSDGIAPELTDFEGCLSLTRLEKICERIKEKAGDDGKRPRLLLMSGTLPETWRERFYATKTYDIIRSEYETTEILEVGMEEELSDYDKVLTKVLSSIKLDPYKHSLSVIEGDQSAMDYLSYGGTSKPDENYFLAIFGYQKDLLEKLSGMLKNHFDGKVDVYFYSASKSMASKDHVENVLQLRMNAFYKGDKIKPMVLLTTNSMTEGLSFPGYQSIVLRSLNPMTSIMRPHRQIQKQQIARLGRIYRTDRKTRAIAKYFTVKSFAKVTPEELSHTLEFAIMRLSDLGDRKDFGGVQSGFSELDAFFPGLVDPEADRLVAAKGLAKKKGLIDEEESLTPLGSLKLYFSNWFLLDSWSPDNPSDVYLMVVFNLLIAPYIVQEDFVRDFSGEFRRFRNEGDSDCRALSGFLSKGRGDGRLNIDKLNLFVKRLFPESDLYSDMALSELLCERFKGASQGLGIEPRILRIMVSFILHGLIYLRLKEDFRGDPQALETQDPCYPDSHGLYVQLREAKGEYARSPIQNRIKRFLKLSAENMGLLVADDATEAIDKALTFVFEKMSMTKTPLGGAIYKVFRDRVSMSAEELLISNQSEAEMSTDVWLV